MPRPSIAIVTPTPATAGAGNRQNAWRWSRLLSPVYRTHILAAWNGERADALIVLHAQRGAESIAAWRAARPDAPLALLMTGADLEADAPAPRALEEADRLVLRSAGGLARLPARLRERTRVVPPSAQERARVARPRRYLRALMVGHLRGETSPETFFKTARLLAEAGDILLDHIGAPLDADLAAAAHATAVACPGYRWLGALPHEETLRRIQRAHVLVRTGRRDDGERAMIEAVRLGTPVLAARADANLGLLGPDYAGYFRWGNATQLAAMLVQCRASMQRGAGLLATLEAQRAALAPRFDPAVERQALHALAGELLAGGAAVRAAG